MRTSTRRARRTPSASTSTSRERQNVRCYVTRFSVRFDACFDVCVPISTRSVLSSHYKMNENFAGRARVRRAARLYVHVGTALRGRFVRPSRERAGVCDARPARSALRCARRPGVGRATARRVSPDVDPHTTSKGKAPSDTAHARRRTRLAALSSFARRSGARSASRLVARRVVAAELVQPLEVTHAVANLGVDARLGRPV